VICVYLFDSIFNEANESSSACEPGIELHVETKYAPNEHLLYRKNGKHQGEGTAGPPRLQKLIGGENTV
jgi:hypothetical protein